MKKAFSARRVPRKVGQDDDEPARADTEGAEVSGMLSLQSYLALWSLTCRDSPRALLTECATEPVLKRPNTKPRKSLRALGPSPTDEDDESSGSGVVTPKRSGLARVAIQRNASKRTSLHASQLPTRQADEDEERPSYNVTSLRELKNSTPSTPAAFASSGDDEAGLQDVEQSTQALDLSSKFGSSLSRYQQSSAIPSATEIAEKKARRTRLAKEQAAEEYISLDPDDPSLDNDDEDGDPNVTRDESGRLILKPKDKYGMAESRLVRDDEDIMEDFDDFTEDGKIQLGRKAEKEAARKRKEEMRSQIAQAEGQDAEDSAEESDASEKERNAAFEAAQTRHGTYAASHTTSDDPYEQLRPKTPPKISPLPTLDGVLERLRKQVAEMQTSRTRKLAEMEALQREKIRLGEEEVRIQKALRETAEKFQQLRAEKGIAGGDDTPKLSVETPKGLEELTRPGTPMKVELEPEVREDREGVDADEDDEDGEEVNGAAGAGLGFAGMRAQGWEGMSGAPGLGMGTSRPRDEEDDW